MFPVDLDLIFELLAIYFEEDENNNKDLKEGTRRTSFTISAAFLRSDHFESRKEFE